MMNYSNTVTVRSLNDSLVDTQRWDNYVQHHPKATLYHTKAWGTILEKSFGYRSWYFIAEDLNSGQVLGCLPLFLVQSPLSRRLVAIPFRDRGGPLWSSPEAFSELIRTACQILKQVNTSYLELKTITPFPTNLVQSNNLSENLYWVNSYTDLHLLNREQLWSKIGSKTRNMIRQAEKQGLTFNDMTESIDGATNWYQLHLVTQKSLGLPPFPLKFFQLMFEELRKINGIKLFVVKQAEQPVAATLLLLFKQTGIYGYSSSNPMTKGLRPNDFMIFNCMTWLIEQGFTEFDLGSDAPSQKGLLFFKKKWLAQQRTIPTYTLGQANSVIADSSAPHYALVRKGFQYLPTSVLRLAGTMITKYFG